MYVGEATYFTQMECLFQGYRESKNIGRAYAVMGTKQRRATLQAARGHLTKQLGKVSLVKLDG